MSDRICIGKIATTHGIKGLVKIFPYAEDPSLIESAQQVFTSETGDETLKITLKNPQGKFILAAIEGITTPEDAAQYKNCELYISRECLPDIKDEESYYYHDLIGLQAISMTGETIGEVIAIDNFGAGDLLEIKISSISTYIPYACSESVDLDNKTISLKDYEMYLIEA